MRLRCKREDLFKAVNKVVGASSGKSPKPILAYLLMETRGGKLRLYASDLKVGIETFLDVRVEEEGEVAVPAKKMEEVIRELPPGGDIAIDTQKNNSILINSGVSHFRLMGMGGESFPLLPEIKNAVTVKINGGDFKDILRHTSFAVSYDERRSFLNGIYFKAGEGVLKFVATDGRRMAYLCRQMDSVKESLAVIVPITAIKQLEQVIEGDNVEILFSEKQISFISEETKLVSGLLAGQFPDYEKIIPKALKYKMTLNRENFLASLRRMALLTGELASDVRFDIGKKKIVFSVTNPEIGEGREEIEYKGEVEGAAIQFNPFYIIDFLKNNDGESIDFQFNDGLSPVVLKPETKDNYLYFLMPIVPHKE